MLWEKESKKPDAFYENILASEEDRCESECTLAFNDLVQKQHPEKSDVIALQKRNDGNEKFRARKWLDAIELYGDSLRFAQPDSEHISLAYANRAACFMSLKLYENCLKDIELAKGAGYPEHLMPKLVQRKENCLEKMQEDPQSERKLTIEQSNDEFPCLAIVAEVRIGENGEYSVVAKTDIDVGEVIAVEDAFQTFQYADFRTNCNICSKEYGNLVPCRNCTNVMFCPECQDNSLHNYECGLNICGADDIHTHVRKNVRSILQTIKAFSKVDDLMEFVEQVQKNPNKLPANLLDDFAKYQIFFNSSPHAQFNGYERRVLCSVYKTLLRIPDIRNMFRSTKHLHFLMHLIGNGMHSPCSILSSDFGVPTAHVSVVMRAYFEHSCDPNVIDIIRDGKVAWISIKPIKSGERIQCSVIPLEIDSVQERKKQLMDLMNSTCECRRCNGNVSSPAQRLQMATDKSYLFVMQNYHWIETNIERADQLLDNCIEFLRKFGRMDWCDEIHDVIKLLWFLYKIRWTSKTDFNQPMTFAIMMKILKNIQCFMIL